MSKFLNTTPAYFLSGILVIASSVIYGFGYLRREISLARSFWKTLPVTIMAGASLTLPPIYFSTVVGVFAFVFSDSVLAARMFVVSDQQIYLMMSWAVWIFYIAGQSLILVGIIGVT